MESAEITKRFLAHFEREEHVVVPSASLVADDPSVLFTIAGMVPFVPYLRGESEAPWKRAVDVQKCIRTNDIAEVGKTARHGTFFQMLGNWSFGDYFKWQAIGMAWSFLTGWEDDGGLGLDPEKLWATYFDGDEDVATEWQKYLPRERIQAMGVEDNYWHTGQPGPGGPCTEIYYDRGPGYGVEGGPAVNDTRYVEIWNLVFMEDLLGAVRSHDDFDIIGKLPARNVDTGMGLERVAMIKQGVGSMYETDQMMPVISHTEEVSGLKYGTDPERDVDFRIVSDHVRSSLMLMIDGVKPGNKSRDYVLRRLLRRAMVSLRKLGVSDPVVGPLLWTSAGAMGASWPMEDDAVRAVVALAEKEEKSFGRSLTAGMKLLGREIEKAQNDGGVLPRAQAFLLHDTYGFPIELTEEAAAAAGVSVDRTGYETLMDEQRRRSRG